MYERAPTASQIYWPYPWCQPAERDVSPVHRARYDNLTATGLEHYSSFLRNLSEMRKSETECADRNAEAVSPSLDPIML